MDFETIAVSDTGESLLFPTQWKTPADVAIIKEKVIAKRKKILKDLSEKFGAKIPVPVEAYIAIALLAHEFNMDDFQTNDKMKEKINFYTAQNINNQYVSI